MGNQMIDFKDTGSVVVHERDGDKCVQLFPNSGYDVDDMLRLLDTGLESMSDDSALTRRRGLLLDNPRYKSKGLPIPCVFLFEERDE
jgi:hypothetical protein